MPGAFVQAMAEKNRIDRNFTHRLLPAKPAGVPGCNGDTPTPVTYGVELK